MSSRSRPITSLSLPPTLLSQLTRDGYETVDDLARDRPELLSQASQSQARRTSQILSVPGASFRGSLAPSPSQLSSSQAVSSLISASHKSQLQSTGSPPLDKVLDGGLAPGRILEISGPPGSCKEKLILSLVRQSAKDDAGVLFIDCQNMTPPEAIKQVLEDAEPPLNTDLVSYVKIHDAEDLFIFLHNIPQRIASCSFTPKILVINSLSFLFQPFLSTNVPHAARNMFSDRLRQAMIKISAAHSLSIVITSQLSVRLLNEDGTTGNFASAVGSAMNPQLGTGYLPAGKSYKVMVVPESRTNGKLRLLSSPRGQPQDKASRTQEDY